MDISKEKFDREGFLLVRNVLSKEEVEKLRKVAYRTIEEDQQKGTSFVHIKAKNHLGCLTNIIEFKDLITDNRVLEIAKKVLGDDPVFFGDSVFEIGIGSRGFHKDTSERKNPNHPDWIEEYPIVRIAFYLEDHDLYSGGLKVRKGSMNTVKTDTGEPYIIPSKAGDAVVFSLRTSHAGNAVRLKVAPKLSLSTNIENRVPYFLKLPEQKERVSIFLTYGLKSGALNRYLEFMFNHKVYKKRIEQSSYPNDLVEELNKSVKFLNVKETYSNYLKNNSIEL